MIRRGRESLVLLRISPRPEEISGSGDGSRAGGCVVGARWRSARAGPTGTPVSLRRYSTCAPRDSCAPTSWSPADRGMMLARPSRVLDLAAERWMGERHSLTTPRYDWRKRRTPRMAGRSAGMERRTHWMRSRFPCVPTATAGTSVRKCGQLSSGTRPCATTAARHRDPGVRL